MIRFSGFILGLALCLSSLPARAQLTFNINNWYWVAGDTNPTSEVFSSATGAFVANNNAAYLSWLSNGTEIATSITAAANNGSGAVRLTVATTVNYQTNQYWNISGTGVYDQNWKLTVIDASHIDLQGSTYTSGVTGGQVSGPSTVPLAMDIYQAIDNYNQTIPRPAIMQTNISTPANPLATVVDMDISGGAMSMPQANLPGSIPLGRQILLNNIGDVDTTVYAFDGVSEITLVRSGATATVLLTQNDTTNGTYLFWFNPTVPGVNCSAGSVTLLTEVVTNGIVTHC